MMEQSLHKKSANLKLLTYENARPKASIIRSPILFCINDFMRIVIQKIALF